MQEQNGDITFHTEPSMISLTPGYTLEFSRKIFHDIQYLHDMFELKSLASTQSEGVCGPRRVLHLPSIDIPLCELHQLFCCDTNPDLHASLFQECCPDLGAGLSGERGEVESDMNPRQECLVECFDAIGGHEQDGGVVFKMTEETGYHRISLQVVQTSLLQENIRLIDEHNGLPSSRKFYSPISQDFLGK
jgi:hypothetical protein